LAKERELAAHALVERFGAAAGEQVRVEAEGAEHGDRVLRGFGLLLADDADDGDEGDVDDAQVALADAVDGVVFFGGGWFGGAFLVLAGAR
jgi:hypothetical protein